VADRETAFRHWLDHVVERAECDDPAAARAHLAVAAAGSPRPPVWMVGDGSVDVAGARAAGIRSIWITRGRRWDAAGFAPDAVAADLEEALELVG
jgi:FMN phosphatase YigB (HAD superfamily)